MSVTSACADLIIGLKSDSVPESALNWAKWGILDCTGVGLAGAATEMAVIIEDYLNFVGGRPQARILGLELATSVPESAMANGALCHALDYDDAGGFGHPSAALLPAIYALADVVQPSGKEALAAYVVGFEVGNCLGECNLFGKIDIHSWQLGWHPTGVYGTIGAACTAARLLGLTREQTSHAIGIAASEASGINKNFGTMTKPLHAGLAARNGVFAALLAQRGFTADSDALGGEQGFLWAFKGPGNYTQELVCARLGKDFALNRGLAIKWFPGGWSTHRATAGVIDLVRQHGLSPADIDTIEVALEPIPTLRLNPLSGVEGKFSIAFNVALGVLKGWPDIEDYSTDRTREPGIRSLMQRVRHAADPADGSVNVAIVTKGGKRFEKNVKHAPNDPIFGLQKERALAKFRKCAAYRLSPDAIAAVEEELLNLDRVTNLSRLMGALTAGTKNLRSS